MAVQIHKCYNLGDFALDPEARVLANAGRPVRLARRPFQVLLYLMENRERLVSRRELLDLYWDGRDVYEETLTKCIGAIRRALDDRGATARFIETRYAEGYRYIGPLKEHWTQPETSFVEIERTRGARLVITEDAAESPRRLALASLPAARRASRALAAALALGLLACAGLAAFVWRARSSAKQAAPPAPSLAVLPLKNLTGDAANEYLSDGLSESLTNELARNQNLRVVARASAFSFKNKETDAREIGQQLGVAYILEGALSKSGERVRVNLRLVNTADGRIVWTGDSFDRALSDILAMQDELSCHIAENLRVVLCGEKPHKRYTDNSEAYQAYLKGRFYWNKRTADGIKKSLDYYNEAIRLDANYALAYAGLAESYVQGVWHVPFAPEEVVPKAKAAALRAVALDDSLAEARTALAGVLSMEWDWNNTGRELQRAIELNPQYARAYHVQAFHLLVMGRYDEAVASIKRAAELDPLNLVVATDTAMILFGARRLDEAFRQWQKALELDPNFVMTHQHLYEAYIVQGDEAAAIAEFLKTLELGGQPPAKIAAYRQIAAAQGLRGIWRKQLAELQAQQARGVYVPPIGPATLRLCLGQKDEAMAQLEQIYRARSASILYVQTSLLFDPLRSDPRFQDLMRRAGLPQ